MTSQKKKSEARAEKKKTAVRTLSDNITRLRMNVTRDMKSDDERLALTAMIVRIIDHTAERVGNDGSANNGHFGITGLQCRHATLSKNRVRLRYIGKSGVTQDKAFTDAAVASLLRKRMRYCKNRTDSIFATRDGFKIRADRVNRYLSRFGVTAKDIRGYLANRFIVRDLRRFSGMLHGEKERHKVFLASVRRVASKVGHQPATLRKHYLLPNLENNYIKYGQLPRIS
jgi:DNA topoisomerase-1